MRPVVAILRIAWRGLSRLVLVLSFVSFVVTCAFWARSQHAAEWLSRESDRAQRSTRIALVSSDGLVLIEAGWYRPDAPRRSFGYGLRSTRWKHGRDDNPPDLRVALRQPYDSCVFALDVSHSRSVSWSALRWRQYRVMFPYWAAAVAFGSPLLCLIRPAAARVRRARRRRRGQCLT